MTTDEELKEEMFQRIKKNYHSFSVMTDGYLVGELAVLVGMVLCNHEKKKQHYESFCETLAMFMEDQISKGDK